MKITDRGYGYPNTKTTFDGCEKGVSQSTTLIEKMKNISKIFENLLGTAQKEGELQDFIKNNPIIIQPYSKVIPKKRLGEDFITDFVLERANAQSSEYTFIEIEKASMQLFTKANKLTEKIHSVEKQIFDWDIWVETNIEYIRRKLKNLDRPKYLIIVGRGNNLSDEQKNYLKAWNRSKNNTTFLTYDDLKVSFDELIKNLEAI